MRNAIRFSRTDDVPAATQILANQPTFLALTNPGVLANDLQRGNLNGVVHGTDTCFQGAMIRIDSLSKNSEWSRECIEPGDLPRTIERMSKT
jgi:hypothetical protein